jgi:hypothetical protein
VIELKIKTEHIRLKFFLAIKNKSFLTPRMNSKETARNTGDNKNTTKPKFTPGECRQMKQLMAQLQRQIKNWHRNSLWTWQDAAHIRFALLSLSSPHVPYA